MTRLVGLDTGRENKGSGVGRIAVQWFLRGGNEWRTFEASAEGSLAVPNSSVAFSRSASFTFW